MGSSRGSGGMSKVIYHYEVEVMDGSGVLSAEKRFDVIKLNVVGENDEYLAVDNRHFSTIQKKLERGDHPIYDVLGRCSISIYNADNCWGNRIWLSLFVESPVTSKFIKRAIEKEIEKRFGYFTGKVDLSFITDRANIR
jgi:hypothetical protein